MIYTITTNPSLDYYLGLEELQVGRLNRSLNEEYDAAGKGVNVSKFLSNMGITSTALGFLGGFTRDHYLELLSKYRCIQPQFTTIKEDTRINIKIHCGEETSLNAKGPYIQKEEFSKFALKFNNMYDDDYVVLSGNIQDEMTEEIINAVGELCKNDTRVVLDTDQRIVDGILPFKPYMICLSSYMDNKDELISIAKSYVEQGTTYVLYSGHDNETYLFEKDGYYTCDFNGLKYESLTGSSDCVIAGFLWAKLRGANSNEAFLYANGIATSLGILDCEVDMKLVEENNTKLKIERCEY